MYQFISGTQIFWSTLGCLLIATVLATGIGRGIFRLFPFKMNHLGQEYLAPLAGLGVLTILSYYWGKFFVFEKANLLLLPLLVLSGWVSGAFSRPKYFLKVIAKVYCFFILAGASLLVPLYTNGVYNYHNDAFTYLFHGNWLQKHLFGAMLSPQTMTPGETQVYMYQAAGYRMGGTYLLALIQGLLKFPLSFQAYLTALIAFMGALFLSLGFPLTRFFLRMPKLFRFCCLLIPSFTLGGFNFGALYGFYPQTAGIAFSVLCLILIGPIYIWLINNNRFNFRAFVVLAFSYAIFLAAAISSYSEFSPFLLLTMLLTFLVLKKRLRKSRWPNLFLLCVILLTGLILNTELLRIKAGLSHQSTAVVGGPIDWSLVGYFGHIVGFHGGGWDIFQWDKINHNHYSIFFFSFIIALAWVSIKNRSKYSSKYFLIHLCPHIQLFGLLLLGILYYRYFVKNPFPVGQGQSWTQFKLANWAQPFVQVLLIALLAPALNRKALSFAVYFLTFAGLALTAEVSVKRVGHIIGFYQVKNVSEFYANFDKMIQDQCPKDQRIFLNLGGRDSGFRKIALLFLDDRELASDWSGDEYVGNNLPVSRRMREVEYEDCVISPITAPFPTANPKTVGRFKIGPMADPNHLFFTKENDDLELETDGKSRWYWVKDQITFSVVSVKNGDPKSYSKLSFDFLQLSQEPLMVKVFNKNGVPIETVLRGTNIGVGGQLDRYSQTVKINPEAISHIKVESTGQPIPLSKEDARLASFQIRNFVLERVDR